MQVERMTMEELVEEVNSILDGFDECAREGRCVGDLFTGWDYPTMNLIFPEQSVRLRELKAEGRKRHEGGA